MNLPKAENKKLIKKNEFAKIAEKVRESLKEEAKYLYDKRVNNEDILSSRSYTFFK